MLVILQLTWSILMRCLDMQSFWVTDSSVNSQAVAVWQIPFFGRVTNMPSSLSCGTSSIFYYRRFLLYQQNLFPSLVHGHRHSHLAFHVWASMLFFYFKVSDTVTSLKSTSKSWLKSCRIVYFSFCLKAIFVLFSTVLMTICVSKAFYTAEMQNAVGISQMLYLQ